MDTLSFRIPEQQLPDENSFDTRPAAVQRWIEELPMGHIGEAAKRLYDMLREVNRLDIPVSNRFELLEGIGAPLHAVFDSLERHYTGMLFPLPAKAQRVAQFASSLLHEVVIAYQSVLNSEENASWFYRMTHTRMWLEAIHRHIYYLNRILCIYRLLHRSTPVGLWLALHRLYWTVRDNNRQNERVTPPQATVATSIESEYKQALLLSMVEPHMFGREQLGQVYANMALWVEHTALVASEQRTEGTTSYCIRREADAPHTKLTDECCEDCSGEKPDGLLLGLEPLQSYIMGLLEELGERDQLKPGRGSNISRETLETLSSCWRAFDSKRYERIHSEVPVEVAVGMSGIFQLLQGQIDSSARGISDQEMSESLVQLGLQDEGQDAAAQNRGTVMGGEPEKDVWNSIFSATQITQKSWSREIEEQEYHFVTALQRDYTGSGYCLEFDKQKMESFQVGELMGVKANEALLMQLCMVRWLSDEDRSISTGLMCLAESMEPALVVVHQAERDTALYCLLGIGKDHKPQLFLPHLPGIQNKELFLVVDGKEVPLSLHQRVVVSPLFDAFHFNAASVAADEEMTLKQMNSQLHELTHLDKEGERDSSDFSDLWNTL